MHKQEYQIREHCFLKQKGIHEAPPEGRTNAKEDDSNKILVDGVAIKVIASHNSSLFFLALQHVLDIHVSWAVLFVL